MARWLGPGRGVVAAAWMQVAAPSHTDAGSYINSASPTSPPKMGTLQSTPSEDSWERCAGRGAQSTRPTACAPEGEPFSARGKWAVCAGLRGPAGPLLSSFSSQVSRRPKELAPLGWAPGLSDVCTDVRVRRLVCLFGGGGFMLFFCLLWFLSM